MTDTTGANPLPETGTLTKSDFFALMAQNDAARAMQRNNPGSGQPMMMMMNPDAFGQKNGDGSDKEKVDRKKDKDRDKDADDEKPIAMRYSKLPKGLPDWFEEYDIDKDGQVALWEWRKAGEPLYKFKEYDLNDDGIITADEYLRAQQKEVDDAKIAAINAGDRPAPPKGRGGQKPVAAEGGDDAEKPAAAESAENKGEKPQVEKTPSEKPMGKWPPGGGGGDKSQGQGKGRPQGKDKDNGGKPSDTGAPRRGPNE